MVSFDIFIVGGLEEQTTAAACVRMHDSTHAVGFISKNLEMNR